MNRVRSLVQRIRDSLFFIPVLGIVTFSGLAILILYFDRKLSYEDESPWLLAATVAGGRSIATTVAGATITVAAIVFSITALSSQIAATQYSPRAVRGFFEDRFQQIVIALIVGTFTYSLLILAGLSTASAGVSEPSPSIAVTINVILGVASAIGIVGYIDHSLKRFQVDSVIRRISNDTLRAVQKQKRDHGNATDEAREQPEGISDSVKSRKLGWVQGINAAKIAKMIPDGATIRIEVRLGDPVSEGDHIASIWPDEAKDEAEDILEKSITVGQDRSLDNDPAFGVRQLVDIALKALSPGINDPTTALDVVHHLKVPIREVLLREAPVRVYTGPSGQRVYLPEAFSRSDFVHAAFAEIRLNGKGQPSVLAGLLDVLGDLRDELAGEDMAGRAAAIDEEWNLTIDVLHDSGLPEADVERVLGGRTKV